MDKYPNALTLEGTQKILNQMNNCIYTIHGQDEKVSIGFICSIKFRNLDIPVLITTYNIINEQYLANKDTVKVSLKYESITLHLGNTKYINKNLDLSIIEIKKDDLDKINILELDECLNDEESIFYYFGKSIYIIHYNKVKEYFVSFGIIDDIDNSELRCFFNMHSNPKISPIFNLSNNKLIGIYKRTSNKHIIGYYFKYIINEFIKEYKLTDKKFRAENNPKNEIKIIINVHKKEVGQNFYFLDNFLNENNNDIKDYKDCLKVLDKSNTELYINNEDPKFPQFQKYFTPEKEGEYCIDLKFSINLTDSSYMFAGCEKITNLNFINFNTKYITNMRYMFYGCKNLKKINLFCFDTRNVINMSHMFSCCKNLKQLDLSSFSDDFSLTSMKGIFFNCDNLVQLKANNNFVNKLIKDNPDYRYKKFFNRIKIIDN